MTTPNSITVTAQSLITAALQEIGALAAGEQASLDDSAFTLQKLQRLIDRWNARRPMIYNVNFTTFTIQANLTPHTIGPTGTFAVNQRPVEIPSIGLILIQNTNAPYVEIPLHPRDQDWWANQAIKGLTSSLPTDFYYSPDWPNGSIYFWPVPTQVNNVLVQSRLVLSEITSYGQQFTAPPGYWDAIIYELALSLCPAFSRPSTPELQMAWKAAIKAIETNNISSPRLASDAPSQPGTSSCRPGWSFLTGMSTSR